MGTTLLVAVTIAYAFVAFDFYLKGDPATAVVFTGYTFANFGFIWAAYHV